MIDGETEMTKKQRDEKRAKEQMALLEKITNDAHRQAREQTKEIKQQDAMDSIDESKPGINRSRNNGI